MATKTQTSISSDVSDIDKCNDEVDPRVQIELERLNTATDDINKLEVDLDVNESERERTLSELEHRRTSQSYHRAEMRVQQLQKELKRAIAKSSLNARRSLLQINSLAYQHQLQLLQFNCDPPHANNIRRWHKQLATTGCLCTGKSVGQPRVPYFEMKAQFNQLLEDQKKRVKSLEHQVGHAKMSYAEALRNLEQISDEIHRTRKYEVEAASGIDPLGARGSGVGAESPLPLTASSPDTNNAEPPSRKVSPPGLSPPDSDSGEEFLRLPEKLGPTASPVVSKADKETVASQMSEYLGLSNLSGGRGVSAEDVDSSQPMAELAIRSQNTLQSVSMSPRHSVTNNPGLKVMETSFVDKQQVASRKLDLEVGNNPFLLPGDGQTDENGGGSESEDRNSSVDSPLLPRDDSNDQIWTEISLVDSPDEMSQTFAKMGAVASRQMDRDYIQYSPLTEQTTPTTQNPSKSELSSFTSVLKNPFLPAASFPERTFQQLSPKLLKRNSKADMASASNNNSPARQPTENGQSPPEAASNGTTTSQDRPLLVENSSKPGDKSGIVHQKAKLDSSLSGWISRSTVSAEMSGQNQGNLNRRQSLDTLLWGGPTTERVKELLSHGMMMLNISSLTERRAKDDSTSDSESLASVEMLTDEQISSLMLDQDIQDACEEVLGTPISEISPLIQDLKQREQQAQQTPKKLLASSGLETQKE
ncbi:hypothetical protein C0J52_15350 [Blattella germanica]|nr:hypothetical protein C0J52_15350 [Blattella germanica]